MVSSFVPRTLGDICRSLSRIVVVRISQIIEILDRLSRGRKIENNITSCDNLVCLTYYDWVEIEIHV